MKIFVWLAVAFFGVAYILSFFVGNSTSDQRMIIGAWYIGLLANARLYGLEKKKAQWP